LLYTMPPSTTHYTLSSQHLTSSILFSFNNTAITEIYTLSLHDALPISKVKIVRWPHADFCCWNSGRIKRGENGAELVPKGKAKRFQQVLFKVLLPPIVVLGAPLAKLQEQPVVEERLLEPERIQPGRLLARDRKSTR